MKLVKQNNKPEKLTESDIDRITKKVLQSEQMFPEVGLAKDFSKDLFAGIKGFYRGEGYFPSKYHSAIERVGKTFLKDWDRQENLISYLRNLQEKIERSSIPQEKKNKFLKVIKEFISVRVQYRQGIENFLKVEMGAQDAQSTVTSDIGIDSTKD